MDYRTILKGQLEQRKVLNPRFSLRSLAQKIELSPSKLSEIMAGKKSLSPKRAALIAGKLGLQGLEREIFVLSTEVENEATTESKAKLKNLIQELGSQKTTQRNAWYFGAIKAIEEEGLNPLDHSKELGLTELQVENAQRYLKRLKRHHPERERLSFEPTSLLTRLQDELLSQSTDPQVDFLFLSEAEAAGLEHEIQSVIHKYKVKSNKNMNRDLRWVQLAQFRLSKKR